MIKGEVQEKICEIVLKHLRSTGNNRVSCLEDIKAESSFIADLGADSLDVVDIVTLVEEEFDVLIPDTLLEQIRTVGQAVDYIERAVSNQNVSEPRV